MLWLIGFFVFILSIITIVCMPVLVLLFKTARVLKNGVPQQAGNTYRQPRQRVQREQSHPVSDASYDVIDTTCTVISED